jgi:DNA replication protein DnaC
MEAENKQPERTLEQMRESQERYTGKFNSLTNPSESELAYAKQLEDMRKNASDSSISGILSQYSETNRKQRFRPYGIALDDAKKVMYAIIMRELETLGDKLALDGNAAEVYHKLARYFIGEFGELGDYDLKKGIYLYGDVGRGKTFLLECLSKMCSAIEIRFENANKPFTSRRFAMATVKEIVLEMARKKSVEALDKYSKGNLLIDDLGNEKDHGDTQKIYGNEYDTIGEVITQRYRYFKQHGAITHATSNLLPSEWKKAYGTRVEDRMYDMFNLVFLDGESKRRL